MIVELHNNYLRKAETMSIHTNASRRRQTSDVPVFIADDNNVDRTILESALRKLGFAVVTFSSGIAAHAAIREACTPLIAVLDWMMPDRSGVAICKDISDNPPPNPVYLLVVTSRIAKSDIAFALDNGANDHVAKPFDIAELQARINVGVRLLESRQQVLDSNQRLLEHTKNIEALAEARAEQLVHADRLSTVGILAAGMAHEINNPTSFIAVNIQTLAENLPVLLAGSKDNASGEQRKKAAGFLAEIPEILAEMTSGVDRIRRIVTGLKSYVRSGPAKPEWVNIDDSIEAALHLCANRLKYHVTVVKNFSDTPPVKLDINQIEQVFVNLFTNAADAIEGTGKDGVLAISTENTDGSIVVTVHDSGPGIPASALKKMFTPFFTTKPTGKGTGLGLSISSNIIMEHGGELFAANHPGGGALFTIRLPAKREGMA